MTSGVFLAKHRIVHAEVVQVGGDAWEHFLGLRHVEDLAGRLPHAEELSVPFPDSLQEGFHLQKHQKCDLGLWKDTTWLGFFVLVRSHSGGIKVFIKGHG